MKSQPSCTLCQKIQEFKIVEIPENESRINRGIVEQQNISAAERNDEPHENADNAYRDKSADSSADAAEQSVDAAMTGTLLTTLSIRATISRTQLTTMKMTAKKMVFITSVNAGRSI